ncbi:hypothetical protein WQ54_26470 [Bacillus sp. SA1-12]|uniref:MFS transporter n=1 Tax=Bacillus sp. SA1-12 TaxID=1455638 RepID=UPI0006273E0B|nr:MFS transporter [Bacillus sp. SA1-12]KKI89414.1 hypothetical protein WQ54_26470 [Bacillus sp. SA1-12]
MVKRTIELFMLIGAISAASNIYLFIPIYSDVAHALSITYREVVYSSTLFTLAYSFGLLSFGPLSELVSKKKVLVFGMAASCLLTLSISFSYSLASFYLFRSAQGFILGSFAPIAYAYCFDLFEQKRRTLVIAIINMGFLMAGIIGQLISSYLIERFDWKSVFYFFSLLYMFLALFSLLFLPSAPRTRMKRHSRLLFSPTLLKPAILAGLAVTFFTLMSFVAFYDGLSLRYAEETDALFYSKCIALAGTPLSLLCGKWMKRYQTKTMLFTCLFIMMCSFLLMLIPQQLMLITAFSLVFVSAIAVFIPTLITFIAEAAADQRSAAISLYSFLLLTGASIGPLVATFLSFHNILLFFSFLFGIAIFFLYVVTKT